MAGPIFVTMKDGNDNSPNTAVPVVLVRHAQSERNRENHFTGWADPPLTDKGVDEARRTGDLLRVLGYRFDVAYSSRLRRAVVTRDLLLAQSGQDQVQRLEDWRLNERHYGALQERTR